MDLLIGDGGIIPADYLNNKGVVHLGGKIDAEFCRTNNISLYPNSPGLAKQMTYTLSYLGPKPLIDLHSAGLKVAEILKKDMKDEISDLAQPMTF